ncbi:hypothetical protein M4D58_23805 [Brevibacillus borstelensis]|uniref:hypothetical protein n=1 Tax=Brevibacillus borstelensis TaxID=45462 RepID=UPI00203F2987|nr:hypothetical protein [Brevibacillus borstelensis]MCM3593651.1 hypothetical protein [Brevibacillus borstelensis]
MIAEWASGLYQFLMSAFGRLFTFLGELFSKLFDGLLNVLIGLFTPILQLIAAVFYFLYKVGLLLISIIEVLYRMVYFFVFVMKGLFVTLIGLSYNGQTAALPDRYQEVFTNVQPALQIMQMDKIAVLCLWAVWIFVAMALIKIVGSRD